MCRWGTKSFRDIIYIISFCPADTHGLKVKNPSGDQSNYGSKTPDLSMSIANTTCNNFLWYSAEYGLQTPSISMNQNAHRRPMGEQALTFSEQVSSVTAAEQGNWETTHGPDKRWLLMPGKQHNSMLIRCCPATTVILTKMPKSTHGVSFTKGKKEDETQLPLKSAGALALT